MKASAVKQRPARPAKIDLVRELPELYRPPTDPVLVEVPEMAFLMVDGTGDPNTSDDFRDAIQALYSVSYTAKFRMKKEGVDYKVPPMEALWWSADFEDFLQARKGSWSWTAMIPQPSVVTDDVIEEAREEAGRKKSLPALAKLRFERFEEGLCAQLMHIGPYSEERQNMERLHAFVAEQGKRLRGKHHEIYLGDPSRTKPERLKTIIRQPCG